MIALDLALALTVAQMDLAVASQSPPTRGSTITLPADPEPQDERLDRAVSLIHDGHPGDALPLIDAVIAQEEKAHPAKNNLVYYSARSMMEGILYGGIAATQNKNSDILNGDWSMAYFLKGFALIDLNRSPEALSWFDKAIALAPMNAHYLAERAEWYKSRREWDKAYEAFESASDAAEFTEDDQKPTEKARALRGMAFSRIEQGRLDDAKGLLTQALKAKPGDEKVLQELDYIKSLKVRS